MTTDDLPPMPCYTGGPEWRRYEAAVRDHALREVARLAGAEHEQQYLHGGCPECGCFYNPTYDWQHFHGCSRATRAQPARREPTRKVWRV